MPTRGPTVNVGRGDNIGFRPGAQFGRVQPAPGFTGRLNFDASQVGGFRAPTTTLRPLPAGTGTNVAGPVGGFRYLDTAELPADSHNTGLLQDQQLAAEERNLIANLLANRNGARTPSVRVTGRAPAQPARPQAAIGGSSGLDSRSGGHFGGALSGRSGIFNVGGLSGLQGVGSLGAGLRWFTAPVQKY